MNGKSKIDATHDIVLRSLKEDFENVEILDVKVDGDIDFDGDEVLRITVIFQGTPKDLSASSVSGVTRHVRPKLTEIGVEAFPIFSFISNKDLEAKSIAPA